MFVMLVVEFVNILYGHHGLLAQLKTESKLVLKSKENTNLRTVPVQHSGKHAGEDRKASMSLKERETLSEWASLGKPSLESTTSGRNHLNLDTWGNRAVPDCKATKAALCVCRRKRG